MKASSARSFAALAAVLYSAAPSLGAPVPDAAMPGGPLPGGPLPGGPIPGGLKLNAPMSGGLMPGVPPGGPMSGGPIPGGPSGGPLSGGPMEGGSMPGGLPGGSMEGGPMPGGPPGGPMSGGPMPGGPVSPDSMSDAEGPRPQLTGDLHTQSDDTLIIDGIRHGVADGLQNALSQLLELPFNHNLVREEEVNEVMSCIGDKTPKIVGCIKKENLAMMGGGDPTMQDEHTEHIQTCMGPETMKHVQYCVAKLEIKRLGEDAHIFQKLYNDQVLSEKEQEVKNPSAFAAGKQSENEVQKTSDNLFSPSYNDAHKNAFAVSTTPPGPEIGLDGIGKADGSSYNDSDLLGGVEGGKDGKDGKDPQMPLKPTNSTAPAPGGMDMPDASKQALLDEGKMGASDPAIPPPPPGVSAESNPGAAPSLPPAPKGEPPKSDAGAKKA